MELGTDGRFSDICLTRLVLLITIGDFQSKVNFPSVPRCRPPLPSLMFLSIRLVLYSANWGVSSLMSKKRTVDDAIHPNRHYIFWTR